MHLRARTTMLTLTKEVMYQDTFDRKGPFFLAADIGGTNSNFGIFLLKPERPELVLSVHFKSQNIDNFTDFFKEVVDYIHTQFSLTFESACVGAAGVVYPHRIFAHPTNLAIEINANELQKATGIPTIFLINDFEAVALGVELLNPQDIVVVNKGVHREHGNMGYLGAGTGLGESVMVWHRDSRRYIPVTSEGGHADAAFYNTPEYALNDYIFEHYQTCPASWETILSGAGIKKIYQFLATQRDYPETASTREIAEHDFNPDRISFYAKIDPRCKDTFDIYIRFYARCAKNFALDCLALNGLYIAGGIAAKNVSMFSDSIFMEEFMKCGKQSKLLSAIPIAIIADYNVSLYGAVVAEGLRKKGLL